MAEQSNAASPDLRGIPVQTLMVTNLDELGTLRFDNFPVGCVYYVNDSETGITNKYVRKYDTDGNFPNGSIISERFPEFASVLVNDKTISTSSDFTKVAPITPLTVSPFLDLDAAGLISAETGGDDRARSHYQRIISGMKSLDIWDRLETAFLFGENHQSSADGSSAVAIKGSHDLSGGTGTTAQPYSVQLSGSSSGFTLPNINASPVAAGKTYVAIFKDDGVGQPQTLISNYEGGSNRGMAMTVAGTPIGGTGAGLLADISAIITPAGSGAAGLNVVDMAHRTGFFSFAACSLNEGHFSVMGGSREVKSTPIETGWINRPNFGLGRNPNNSFHFSGELAFVAIFDDGLSNQELFELRLLLESSLGDSLDFGPSVVFEGNSLTSNTGGIAGGGQSWPTMLMQKDGWAGILNENVALGGARQLERIESQYATKVRRWVGNHRSRRMFFLWTGINDVTANSPTEAIINSIRRHIIAAKQDGFYVVLLPLTPVRYDSTPPAYGYGTARQESILELNAWIASEGAELADQFVDINQIPEMADPLDPIFYFDGLHHTDAGRRLISDYIAENVEVPS